MVGQERPAPVHWIGSGLWASWSQRPGSRGWERPGAEPLAGAGGARQGAGEDARSRGGRSPAGKSSQVRTRLALQNGADFGAAADSGAPGRGSTSSSSPRLARGSLSPARQPLPPPLLSSPLPTPTGAAAGA